MSAASEWGLVFRFRGWSVLHCRGMELPMQSFFNRTLRLQGKLPQSVVLPLHWNMFLTVGAHALARGCLQAKARIFHRSSSIKPFACKQAPTISGFYQILIIALTVGACLQAKYAAVPLVLRSTGDRKINPAADISNKMSGPFYWHRTPA